MHACFAGCHRCLDVAINWGRYMQPPAHNDRTASIDLES
jgi:hypothetical protein